MSQNAARAFIERMKSDAAFRDAVFAETDVDARMSYVRAAGFDPTTDELEPPSGALADAEVDAVTGGRIEPGGPYYENGNEHTC